MNIKRTGAIALVAVLLLTLIVSMSPVNAEEEAPTPVTWTFMVYMDGDNNLEGASVNDMNEMETVGSSDEVNIIVLHDRIEGEFDDSNGDLGDTRLYRVTKDENPDTISSIHDETWGIDELNMGDPETLIRFVSYCVDNYPADHYLLSMWDHGGAWHGICWDDSSEDEDGNHDRITLGELNYAMSKIHDKLGRKIDVLGFDACLMAQVAVLYELEDYVDYCIASGYVEPGDGWPYETIMMRLINVPDMTPEELGDYIAKAYVDSYTDRIEDPSDARQIVQACFDLSNFDSFILELEKFSMFLAARGGDWAQEIYQARAATTGYDMASIGPYDFFGYAQYDIIGFTLNLEARILLDSQLRDRCSDLRAAAKNIISAVYVDMEHSMMPNKANGLTIYFPNRDQSSVPGSTTYDNRFDEINFAKARYWDDFLKAYHSMTNEDPATIPPTVIFEYPSAYNTTLNTEETTTLIISVRAFDLQNVKSVTVSLDGGDPKLAESVGAGSNTLWTYTINIMELAPGKHSIAVQATDDSSMSSTVLVQTFTVEGKTEVAASDGDGDGGGPDINIIPFAVLGIVIIVVIGILILVKDKLSRKKKGEVEE